VNCEILNFVFCFICDSNPFSGLIEWSEHSFDRTSVLNSLVSSISPPDDITGVFAFLFV